MSNAIIVGLHQFPQHLGRVVEIVSREELWDGVNPATTTFLYRTCPVLSSGGQEIYWASEHLAQLPLDVNDIMEMEHIT